jgi:2-keto-3-deoxy-L-rhamnonate aldolase RhmA
LHAGEPLLGTFVKSSDPAITELLAAAEFDYVVVDLVHSNLTLASLADLVRAACIWTDSVVVRLPPERLHEAGQALETGVAGIQITGISSHRELTMARRAVRLPPDGDLGLSLAHRASGFGPAGASRYLSRINNDIAVVVQLESHAALEALPELLATEQPPDAWFLGPVDLSCDLGHPGDVGHPTVQAALDRAADMILAKGQKLAIFAGDISTACRWRTRGATAVTLSSDLALLSECVAAQIEAWRQLSPRVKSPTNSRDRALL